MSAIRASRIAPIVNGSGPEGPDPSGSSSPDELVAVDLDDAVERDRQLRERLALELPNTLAVETERLADRLERLALAVEAETKLQDPPLALRQPRQRLANGLSLERLRGFLRRILSGRIAEEVAELSVVGRADRLVQRRRRLRDGECLGHVAKLEPGRLRKLLRRRLVAELRLELVPSARDLHAALVDVHGDADRRRLVRHCTLAGLANPPGRVRRELVAATPVELLDGTVQPDHALLDQVEQGQVVPLVALRNRDDEAQVAVDHPLLCSRVAALEALRQCDLLRRGEEPVPARPVHEERQRVGRAGQLGPDSLDRDRLLGLGLDDLDLAGLQLGPDAGELFLIEVVLERKSFEVGRLDRPPLLGLGEKRLNWSFEHGGAQFCSLPSSLGVSAATVER